MKERLIAGLIAIVCLGGILALLSPAQADNHIEFNKTTDGNE